MEESQPQELEELVGELEGESGAEEALSPEVEGFLHILEAGSLYLYSSRRIAAKQLGGVSRSRRRIVKVLMMVAETDSSDQVRAMAAESPRAPAHQAVLQQYPDLMEATERPLHQAPGKGEEDPGLASPDSAGGRRQDLVAKRLGVIGAVLCGVLILAIVATTVLGFTAEGTGEGMAYLIFYFFFIPLASIPVGLICLAGAILSRRVLRRQSSPDAQTAQKLSLGGPAAVLACYVICLLMLMMSGA